MPKRKTHEEFIEEMKYINPNIEIIGQYVNAKTKIDCNCKICGHKWSPTANHLLEGYGCSNCANISRRKTHKEFVNEMKEVNPNFTIIGKYQGDNKYIEVECEKHHIWNSLPTNLRKGKGVSILLWQKSMG